jgi:hypothetical protein
VKEYIEEFYKLNIRAGHRENEEEKVYRYINGLRYEIHDDISMITMRTMEDAYRVAMKVEEKLARKQSQRNKGKIPNRGRGIIREKFQKPKVEVGRYHSQIERGGISRGGHYGGRNSFPRGRGGEVKCYAYEKTRYMYWECPEKKNVEAGEAHISKVKKRNVEIEMKEEATKEGRSLMMRKVLVNLEKEA